MGTGEYVSVTNQNELVGAEVATERTMHARFPAAEQAELADTFIGYGADAQTATRMAAAVSADPDTALRVHTREELGVDPFELPSPLFAGVSSFSAFSAGALIPLLPYLAGLSFLGAALGVAAVALLTGGSPSPAGARQRWAVQLGPVVAHAASHPASRRRSSACRSSA